MAVPTFGPANQSSVFTRPLRRMGLLIIDAIDTPMLDAISDELEPMLAMTPPGDNPVDGFTTRRILDPLARTRALDPLVLHPQVQALVAGFLSWPYQLGMTFVSEVLPRRGRAAAPPRRWRWSRTRPVGIIGLLSGLRQGQPAKPLLVPRRTARGRSQPPGSDCPELSVLGKLTGPVVEEELAVAVECGVCATRSTTLPQVWR